jgi:hypothetical protein
VSGSSRAHREPGAEPTVKTSAKHAPVIAIAPAMVVG